ncbi:MAG: MATE family efflux transporter [Kiloniellales bacterium]|nr:MATE family efflux transporter [Kiloniellales bacterium]
MPQRSDAVALRAGTAGPWMREFSALARLALPLALTQVAQIAHYTTDVIMIGRLGPEALAAAQLGMNLFMPLWLFGLGIVMAVSPMVAQALGAKQYRAVRRSVRQGMWVAIAVSVPFGFILAQGEAILLAFGQSPENAAGADAYLDALLWSLPPSLCLIVLRAFIAAHSRPRAALLVLVNGIWLNALLNYMLIFGNFGFPAMGLVGAGIATVIVNFAMVAALLLFVLQDRRFKRYFILVRFWRSDWPRFREILRLGLPIGATIVAESTLFASAGILMGLIGTEQLAAHAIAMQCASVAFMVPLGISQAATVRVGLAAGAGDAAGVGRAGWLAFGLGIVTMSISAMVFWLMPETLTAIFLSGEGGLEIAVAAYAASFLLIAGLFQLFDGSQVVLAGCLRGLKDTRVPMIFAMLGYWGIGLPSGVLFAFVLDLEGRGIWFGMMTGLAAVAVMVLWRFQGRARFGLLAQPVGPS